MARGSGWRKVKGLKGIPAWTLGVVLLASGNVLMWRNLKEKSGPLAYWEIDEGEVRPQESGLDHSKDWAGLQSLWFTIDG